MNGLDRDGDGIAASADNCDAAYNPDQSDADQDGVGDLCDPCPSVANEYMYDDDHDGIPNCKDSCPHDARSATAPPCDKGGDADCDGICDSVDLCPLIPNPGQENANADAEEKWTPGEIGMGDVCEPVPVPAGDPSPFTVLQSKSIKGDSFVAQWQDIVQNKMGAALLPRRRIPQYRSLNPLEAGFRWRKRVRDLGVLVT